MKVHRITRLSAASCAAALLIALLAGCASFPTPSRSDESLVVFVAENPAPQKGPERGQGAIRFKGPGSFTVRPGRETWRAFFIKVRPGSYTLDTRGLLAGAAAPLVVPPASVVLVPYKLSRVSDGETRARRLVPVEPMDQEKASAELVDYIDFGRWFGRMALGFGAYMPQLVPETGSGPYTVTSTPPGAKVLIDDNVVGSTPLTTTLSGGEHLLELELPGVALTRTYIIASPGGSIDIKLPLLPTEEKRVEKEESRRHRIVIAAFQNMGGAETDNLAAVFPQTIRADLKDDPRLAFVDAGPPPASGGRIPAEPDFAEADRRGIDLIVSGYYLSRPDGLLVYAALYDVRTRMARSSIVYSGRSGLSMFDSIDAMTTEFIAGVNRALPEIGKKLVDAAAGAEASIVSYEKKRTQDDIVAARASHKSSLALIEGPWIAVLPDHLPALPNALLGVLPVGVAYDYTIADPLSLSVSLQPAVVFDTRGNSSIRTDASYVSVPYLDLPLRVGPTYTVPGYSTDFSVGLMTEARYVQAYFDNGSGGMVYKGMWLWSLSFATTTRFYLTQRLSDIPQFFLVGFNWYLAGFSTKLDFTRPRPVPLEIGLTLGYGVRL